MKKVLNLIAIAALLITAGCSQKSAHNPQDTVLGSCDNSSCNWIDDSNLYAEGLALRDAYIYNGVDIATYAQTPPKESVYFGFDQCSLPNTEREKLSGFLKNLEENEYVGVLIIGRCDWHGTHAYNLTLGEKRAQNVENYLTQLGLAPHRIRTLSKGSLNAQHGLAKNDSWQDRRADLIIMR